MRMRSDDKISDRRTIIGALAGVEGVTEAELVESLVDFIIAGAESPAGAFAWVLAELAQNHDTRERCYKEVCAAVGAHGGVTADALKELPFVEATVKESFRLHTPNTVVHRTVLKPSKLAGVSVLPGIKVGVCIHALHMHKGILSEPERFNPERHLGKAGSREEAVCANMPFTAGRGCPGGPTTLCWAKVIIASVLTRFQFVRYHGYHPSMAGPGCVSKFSSWERDGITISLARRSVTNAARNKASDGADPELADSILVFSGSTPHVPEWAEGLDETAMAA